MAALSEDLKGLIIQEELTADIIRQIAKCNVTVINLYFETIFISYITKQYYTFLRTFANIIVFSLFQ